MSNLPVTFESKIKSKIKADLADLVPDEVWEHLVAQQIDEFMKKDLTPLIKDELKAHFGGLIRLELSKPEWSSQQWLGSNAVGSEMVQKVLIESAPNILAALMAGAAQQVVYNLQNQFPQRPY